MSIQQKNEGGGSLAALFVRRPVLAIVVNAMIVVAGLAAFFGIEVRELPSVEQATLTITTNFTGASAQTVDHEITSQVESAIARVQGVASISSNSSNGQSEVQVGLASGTNMDVATSDMRDAMARTVSRLPVGVTAPTIVKADPNAQAIIQLAVTSDTLSMEDLTLLVNNTIQGQLAAVPGVAQVQIYGAQNKVFQIDVDPVKLASFGMTVADVSKALSSMSFDAAAGSINGANQNISVRATAQLTTPKDFEDIIINGRVRLGDVAGVVFAAKSSASGLHANGKTGIGLGIVRQAQSNSIRISEGVHKVVDSFKTTLPAGVNVNVSSDDSVFIEGAVHEVEVALIIAVAIVIGIIYLFLLDWRAIVVPALSMPIALIGTIAGIYLAGFSLNILTLLALVLATGLVVDDSIVVLENIVRRRAMGAGPRAAAVLGTKEVFFAVVATTLTLAAVFIPLSFLPGQTGQLFREFGFTLAISVGLSGVVALSLGPMLASRLLKEHDPHQGHNNAFNRMGRVIGRFYRSMLGICLDNPLVVVLVALLFAGSTWFIFGSLHQEITPPEDRSGIRLSMSAPPTVSLDFTRIQMQKIEDLLQPMVKSGEIRSVFSISGFGTSTSSGNLTLTLAPWGERSRSQAQIVAEINQLVRQVPGIRTTVRQNNSLGIRGGGSGLQFAVAGSNYDALAATANAIKTELEKNPQFGTVTVNYSTDQPQLTLSIDRGKAAAMGIDINGLGTTMQSMIDGADIGTVFLEDQSYTVTMVSTTNQVNDPRDLENISIKTADGRFVPMSTIATLVEEPAARSLGREQQRQAVSVTASLTDQLAMGDAYNQALKIAQPLLQPGMSILPLAEAKTLGESNNGLAITFGFALVVIFMVLAAQFESMWSAVIVMTTVPFGLACAIYALFLTGGSLNIYSQIGLILVVGIMAKNGILIVEFANQLRDQGLSVRQAIEDASNIRLRPVMMTMIATILGGVPLVISKGAGAEARQALGWIIVGGLAPAAISTLFLTPVAYLALARFSKPKAEEEARLQREMTEAGKVEPLPAE